MMRPSAVRSLLLDDIGSLAPPPTPGEQLTHVSRARFRALLIVALDWLAIAILFLWRGNGPFLALGATEEAVFSLGVLAVATHSGYRLAQMQTLGAIHRALESLPRDGDEAP